MAEGRRRNRVGGCGDAPLGGSDLDIDGSPGPAPDRHLESEPAGLSDPTDVFHDDHLATSRFEHAPRLRARVERREGLLEVATEQGVDIARGAGSRAKAQFDLDAPLIRNRGWPSARTARYSAPTAALDATIV